MIRVVGCVSKGVERGDVLFLMWWQGSTRSFHSVFLDKQRERERQTSPKLCPAAPFRPLLRKSRTVPGLSWCPRVLLWSRWK